MNEPFNENDVILRFSPLPPVREHEDLAEEYVIVNIPDGPSGLMIWSKYRDEWLANHPQSGRPVVRWLLAEINRLRGHLRQEPLLKRVEYTPETGILVDVEHWAVRLMAGSLLDTFRECGGKNFVTMTVNSDDGPLEVTIRPEWGGKKTPAMVLAEERERNDSLTEQLAAANREIARLQTEMSTKN